MKQRIQGMVMGILLTVIVLGTTTVAFAASQTISVTYGINVIVNGIRQTFTDDMRPFQSGGRVFLPVRGIAEALGAEVSWDAATSTVHITGGGGGAPTTQPAPAPQPPVQQPAPAPTAQRLLTAAPIFEHGHLWEAPLGVYMLGNHYAEALVTNAAMTNNGWSHHNLNGQFNTLTGVLGRIDGRGGSHVSTIRFIGDGTEIASFNVDRDFRPTDITVDVSGVSILRIEINIRLQPAENGVHIAFANAMIR